MQQHCELHLDAITKNTHPSNNNGSAPLPRRPWCSESKKTSVRHIRCSRYLSLNNNTEGRRHGCTRILIDILFAVRIFNKIYWVQVLNIVLASFQNQSHKYFNVSILELKTSTMVKYSIFQALLQYFSQARTCNWLTDCLRILGEIVHVSVSLSILGTAGGLSANYLQGTRKSIRERWGPGHR